MKINAPGQIFTFYSYKGGTGRTMALANTACLLARKYANSENVSANEPRVVGIDWDFEAPGLHRYFESYVEDVAAYHDAPGCLEFFEELSLSQSEYDPNDYEGNRLRARERLEKSGLERYLIKTTIPGLSFIKAGRLDSEDYAKRVSQFDWLDFFTATYGLFAGLTEYLRDSFQFVLVDSRTGITDSSGICTMLLPDKLIVAFTPNQQSLTGVKKLVSKAIEYRRNSPDLRPIVVFPLASRIEMARPSLFEEWRFKESLPCTTNTVRIESSDGYQVLFEKLFRDIYRDDDISLREYFDEVQIQHVPDYAYGEPIAVELESSGSRIFLRRSYEAFVERLVELDTPWESLETMRADRALQQKCADAHKLIEEGRSALSIGYTLLEATKNAREFDLLSQTLLEIARAALQNDVASAVEFIQQAGDTARFCCTGPAGSPVLENPTESVGDAGSASFLEKLGELCVQARKLDIAKRFFADSLGSYKQEFGESHPAVKNALARMSNSILLNAQINGSPIDPIELSNMTAGQFDLSKSSKDVLQIVQLAHMERTQTLNIAFQKQSRLKQRNWVVAAILITLFSAGIFGVNKVFLSDGGKGTDVSQVALQPPVPTDLLVGSALLDQGKAEDAIKVFQARKLLLEDRLKASQNDVKLLKDMGETYLYLGDAQKRLGQLGKALEAYRISKQLTDDVLAKNPGDQSANRQLAYSHNMIGFTLLNKSNLDEAISEFYAGQVIMERLIKQDASNTDWQNIVMASRDGTAKAWQVKGKLEVALSVYRKILSNSLKLVSRDGPDVIAELNRSNTYIEIGDVLEMQGELLKAMNACKESRKILGELAAQDASRNAAFNFALQANLAAVSDLSARILLADGTRIDEAMSERRATNAILEKLVAQEPSNADLQHDLAFSHYLIGRIFLIQGGTEEAAKELAAADEMLGRMLREHPDRLDAQPDMMEILAWKAEILLKSGKVDLAKIELDHGEKLFKQADKSINSQFEWQRQHARLLGVQALIMRKLGDQAGADLALNWAEEIYLRLLKASPRHSWLVQGLDHLRKGSIDSTRIIYELRG